MGFASMCYRLSAYDRKVEAERIEAHQAGERQILDDIRTGKKKYVTIEKNGIKFRCLVSTRKKVK